MNTTSTENAKFTITGRLIEKGSPRFVGEKGTHRVCSFVLQYMQGSKEQLPIFEAVREAIDQLHLIREGKVIVVSGVIKGRIRKPDGEHIGIKYSNILEAVKIEECKTTSLSQSH